MKYYKFAAPMDGFTEPPFMKTIWRLGAPDFMVTPFYRVNKEGFSETKMSLDFKPYLDLDFHDYIGLQLMGNSPESMAKVAKFAQSEGFKWIDINIGCPSKTVLKNKSGAFLLQDLPLLQKILLAVRDQVSVKLSAKIRVGMDNDSKYLDLLEMLNQCGLDFLIVHARTVKDGYKNPANHKYVQIAKEIVQVPIVANGDLYTEKDIQDVKKKTGCDGAMIGRGMLSNPWIFRNTTTTTTTTTNNNNDKPISSHNYYQFLKDLYQEFINHNINYCNIKPNKIKPIYLLNRLKAHLIQLSANPLLNRIDRKTILRTSTVDDFFRLLQAGL